MDTLTNQKGAVYLSQICVGGYSLAAVTLAGTLARAPALVLATHWYLPTVRLDSVGMNRLLGPSTTPKYPSISSWPLRRQLMLAEAGWALQRRFTLPPSFCTTDMGSSVNSSTLSEGKESSQKQIKHLEKHILFHTSQHITEVWTRDLQLDFNFRLMT